MDEILSRHRGPYLFVGMRPFATKSGFYRSEVIARNVERDEVEELALTFVSDPRDSLVSISVWSETEEQFVTTVRRNDGEHL